MLTINDVEKFKFGTSMFGYSRADVEEFVAMVVDTLQQHLEEIERLKKELAQAEAGLQNYRASEETLRNSIMMAQKSRDEIVAASRREAELIVQEAQLKAVEFNAQIAQLAADRERFEFEFHGLLKGFLEMLEARNPRLARGSEQLSAGRQPPVAHAEGPAADQSSEIAFPEELPR